MSADDIKLPEPAKTDFDYGGPLHWYTADQMRAAILADRASRAAPPPQGDAWMPIETAPRDGTEIILGALQQTYMGNPVAARVTVGRWTTEEECRTRVGDCGGECRCPEYDYEDPSWLSWDGGFTAENPPTHWMPLPAVPDAARSTPATEKGAPDA